MRAHEKPKGNFAFDLEAERANLERHRQHRAIPAKAADNLLIATWNLTNFGVQQRQGKHLQLMADMMQWFDIVAVQELADNLTQFHQLLAKLGPEWAAIYTDVAGNDERLAYVYHKTRLSPTGLSAELAMRRNEEKTITISVGEVEEKLEFEGFNRNPFMMNFVAGQFEFTLVNVHLYWTDTKIRLLEAKALGKWAKSRVKKNFPPNNDILLLGDFNMPRVKPGDEFYEALVAYGVQFPKHTTELIGSNLAGDKHYDEVAFFPKQTKANFTGQLGVFDFDKVLFPQLWDETDKDQQTKFYQYIRYYMADHRPLWAEFKRDVS
jgi:endonuclease/exonuclease/phosphatase family metal-dependent hydrolase